MSSRNVEWYDASELYSFSRLRARPLPPPPLTWFPPLFPLALISTFFTLHCDLPIGDELSTCVDGDDDEGERGGGANAPSSTWPRCIRAVRLSDAFCFRITRLDAPPRAESFVAARCAAAPPIAGPPPAVKRDPRKDDGDESADARRVGDRADARRRTAPPRAARRRPGLDPEAPPQPRRPPPLVDDDAVFLLVVSGTDIVEVDRTSGLVDR